MDEGLLVAPGRPIPTYCFGRPGATDRESPRSRGPQGLFCARADRRCPRDFSVVRGDYRGLPQGLLVARGRTARELSRGTRGDWRPRDLWSPQGDRQESVRAFGRPGGAPQLANLGEKWRRQRAEGKSNRIRIDRGPLKRDAPQLLAAVGVGKLQSVEERVVDHQLTRWQPIEVLRRVTAVSLPALRSWCRGETGLRRPGRVLRFLDPRRTP